MNYNEKERNYIGQESSPLKDYKLNKQRIKSFHSGAADMISQIENIN